jgi:hypothetical protein
MQESFAHRLECNLLYGQRGLGTVSSNTSGALLITNATWAPGIWSGMKDAVLEAFDGVTGTDSQHNADLTISSVDLANKTITVTGTNAAVVANDVLFFKGSRTTTAFNEAAGIDKILANTGTLFNISASTYEMWKAASYSVGGAISRAGILLACNKAVGNGLMEDVALIISPAKWAVLMNDEASLRQYDAGYNGEKSENGSSKLVFHNVNGSIEIISHPMVKEGEAFLVPLKRVKRVGSSDVTFKLPGMDDLVAQVNDQNAFEVRMYSDQAVFIECPARCVKLSGIT